MLKPWFLAVAAAASLAACADQDAASSGGPRGNLFSSAANLESLRQSKGEGSEFARSLRLNYMTFAAREAEVNWDFVDSDTFARKGLIAARGQHVLPEDPRLWPVGSMQQELLTERQRLMKQLDSGARERAGNLAGVTQVMYDCWIEEEAEGYQPDDIASCRGRYLAMIGELEGNMASATKVAATPIQAAPTPAPVQEFVVHFDFDRSTIRPSENAALQRAAAAYAANKNVKVQVVGYTDTSGSDQYNIRLSRARATAVADALGRLGVNRQQIGMSWRGEQDLAVPTGDNVREERNRRVTISMN